MSPGWGEIARVCRSEEALVIHLDYDGASLMLFKVFDEDGRRLECFPRGSGRSSGAAGTRPTIACSSSSSSDGRGRFRPPALLIWMGLVPAPDGPLLMMASPTEAHVVNAP